MAFPGCLSLRPWEGLMEMEIAVSVVPGRCQGAFPCCHPQHNEQTIPLAAWHVPVASRWDFPGPDEHS